jgi:hypothetical protein
MKRRSPVKPLKSCFPKVFVANAAILCSDDETSRIGAAEVDASRRDGGDDVGSKY